MNLQSLQDLQALLDVRNITLAARRRNISQSAFSRRLQAIEDYYGVALVDRSVRPARPTPALQAMSVDIERAITDLRRLENNLTHSARSTEHVSVAAIHALASGALPAALGRLDIRPARHTIHLYAANQDACITMLLTEQVHVAFTYETAQHPLAVAAERVETSIIASDRFEPVCSPAAEADIAGCLATQYPLPLLSYPADLFLGRVLFDEVLPATSQRFAACLVSAFTNSLMVAAREGAGIAWLPHSLIVRSVAVGELVVLDDARLPAIDLDVVMLQLKARNTEATRRLWVAVAENMTALLPASRSDHTARHTPPDGSGNGATS